MNAIVGKVGDTELRWLSAPRGNVGKARVQVVGGQVLEVCWKRDADGLWLELPTGMVGFDFEPSTDDEGRPVYRMTRRGSAEQWDTLSFLRAGEEGTALVGAGTKRGARVRAQMPGKILRMLVQVGVEVKAGQPLLVMEAMKMENEIKAQVPGRVREIKVSEGQAVETGADLFLIDSV